MRPILLVACLVAAAVVAPGVAAMKDPVGGCTDEATVEVCQPVCVTTPCNPYVCVDTKFGEECVRP